MKTTKQPAFKKGQLVTWTSQAGGNTTTKTGVIVEVVSAGKKPSTLGKVSAFGEVLWHGQSIGMPRKQRSYVVALLDNGNKPAKSPHKRYWPLTSRLAPVVVGAPGELRL